MLCRNAQNKCDEAATHARVSLDVTQRAFGKDNLLTSHRMLRLGTIEFGCGHYVEASDLLKGATDIMRGHPAESGSGAPLRCCFWFARQLVFNDCGL